MKKFILSVFVLLLVGLAGAAIYVTNIDWNQHKDKIAEQFYNSTGKTISFDGRLSFKIFPTPYLNAADAKIYNTNDKTQKPLLEIKNVVAELALMPLIKGEFHVKKMTLDGVVINIDWSDEGLSWQSDLSPDQRQMMEDTNMILNSVSLKNAELNFEDSDTGVGFKLTNLNGEIFAQSIFGPFRIEGNYVKGTTPEGFALSIGKMSENMATTINMAVTHPLSESYVRFDGSFHLVNRVLNGSVIVESKKLSDFINANFEHADVPNEYNKPAAIGFDIALNQQKLGLSNIVIKYEGIQGAGVLDMPLDDAEVPEITTTFNFSDFDLTPIVDLGKKWFDKYKENPFVIQYPVDLSASVTALRPSYNGQGLKNLETNFSLIKDTLTIDNFALVLPGNTDVKLKGNIYPYEDELYYQADINMSSNDLVQTLEWLKINPKANAASVYKKMMADLKVAGNFDRIQISPYKITLDKTTLTGEAGIVLGDRTDMMVVVNADAINFDNYISPIPEEEKAKSWLERMAYRFTKLGMLNDFDLVLDAQAGLLIYESMPFEKVDFKGNLLNGVMDVEYAKVEKMANTALGMKGKLSGFGSSPQADNLQYEINSSDVGALINKLELKVPDLDYKKFSNLSMDGTVNGTIDSFGINTKFTLGKLNAAYQGVISDNNGNFDFDGDLEVKHPDFVTLLEDLKLKYQPDNSNLGPFNFMSKVTGNKNAITLDELNANIGYTAVTGNVNIDNANERPLIMGDLSINKLEIDKFLPKTNSTTISVQPQSSTAEFLAKPFLNKNKIDYTPYIYTDVKAMLNVVEMSYKNYITKDCKFGLEMIGGTLNVKDFVGTYNNAPLQASMSWYMLDNPTINASLKINDANANNFGWGGSLYNLKTGKFSAQIDFSSKADTQQSFVDNFSGKALLSVSAAEVGGINLEGIYGDLTKRDKSEGLAESVKSYIGSGKTLFSKIFGRAIFENGKYSLSDVEMVANNANIKVYGDGDLTSWDMNVVFNTKYSEPKYLPEFSFSLKNSMENPIVDVNVSALFKLFKTREEQQQAAKNAEIEAEKAYWRGLADEQKKLADNLLSSTREKLEKDLEVKMNAAVSPENVNKYNVLKQEIAKLLTGLVEVMENVNGEMIDEAVIEKMKTANLDAVRQVEAFTNQRDQIYLDDLKKQNETEFNKIVEMHNRLKQNIFNYNAQMDKYNEQLSSIITDYKLTDDQQFQKMKSEIDNVILEMESLNDDALKAQSLKKADASIEEYEGYNKNLTEIFTAIKDGREKLIEKIEALEDYASPKINDEVNKYYEKQKEEEEQRKLEENTGSISVKKTGKTFTITRDIEEIRNAEEEISKEGVKVLDFSKEKVNLNKQDKSDNENVIKKGRNIRVN